MSGGDLYHFGQRLYDPSTGRWTQTDPLDQTGDLKEGNQYVYVAADPLNNVDPTGTILLCAVVKACRNRVAKPAAKAVGKRLYPINTVACYVRKSVIDDNDTEGWGDAVADGVNCANPASGVTGDVPGGDG